MSTSETTPTKTEATHLTADLLGRIVSAYGDTDGIIVKRALAVNAALAFGVDVKTMAEDIAGAARADETGKTPTVSQATLGYAKFATTAAEIIGTDLRAWAKRDVSAVAAVVRAAKKHGLGPVGKAVRESVTAIDKSKTFEREEAVMTAVETELAKVKPVKATRAGTPNDETGEETAPTVRETVSEEMTGRAGLATLRALTAWLTTGTGSWSPDLESAAEEFRTAMSAARKRGAVHTAVRTGATTETVTA